MKPGRGRFEHSRDHRRVAQRQRTCATGRGRRFDSSRVDGGRSRSGRSAGSWPRRKPVRVRPVTPIQTSQPTTERVIWDQQGLISPAGRVRFPHPHPMRKQRDHGPVAQSGSAAPLQGDGCGFESRSVHSRRRSPTGRGTALRRRTVRVRIPPSVPMQQPAGRGATGAHRLRVPEVGGSTPSVQTNARWWNRYHACL